MTLEWKSSVLAQYVVDRIKLQTPSVFDTVFYGDQDRIPGGLILCVEPDKRTRELSGAPRKVAIDVDLYLLVYINKLLDSEAARKMADEVVEGLEEFLHTDPQMNGQVIHNMVTNTESGYSNKGNTLIRTSRITLSIQSQQFLPLAQ